jgi:outer membrane protein assembly factor BamB
MAPLSLVTRLLSSAGALFAGLASVFYGHVEVQDNLSTTPQWSQIWGGTAGFTSAPAIYNASLKWSFFAAPYHDPSDFNDVNGMVCIGPNGTVYYSVDNVYALQPDGVELWSAPYDSSACAFNSEGSNLYSVSRGSETVYLFEPQTGNVSFFWVGEGVEYGGNTLQVVEYDNVIPCFDNFGACHILDIQGEFVFEDFEGNDVNPLLSSGNKPDTLFNFGANGTYLAMHNNPGYAYSYDAEFHATLFDDAGVFTSGVRTFNGSYFELLFFAGGLQENGAAYDSEGALTMYVYYATSWLSGQLPVLSASLFHCDGIFDDMGIFKGQKGYWEYAITSLPQENAVFFCGQKFGADGPIWVAPNCSFAHTAAVAAGSGSVIYTTCRGNDLTALSSTDGSVLWTIPMQETVVHIAVSADGTIYVTDGAGLHSVASRGQVEPVEATRHAVGQTAAMNALPHTTHKDAKFAIRTIRSAIGQFPDRSNDKDPAQLGPLLIQAGFKVIQSKGDRENGDVAIWSKHPSHPRGHIQIFNEGKWYADYAQDKLNPWKRKQGSEVTFYRYYGEHS